MKKLIIASLFLIEIIICHAQTGLPFDVQHYRFDILLNDNNDSVKGRAEIIIKALEPVSSIVLDLKNISNNKGMKVNSVTGGGNNLRQTHNKDKLTVEFKNPLRTGEDRTIEISYSGIPADGLIIAKSKYGKRTFFSDNWPNRAHHWLPCVDHPADKSSVEFIVTAPAHYQVVSNGIQLEESNLPGNLKVTHWKEEVPLPTKIMVIGVADFAVQYAGDASGIPIYSWVYPENRKEGFHDYEQAKEILPFFINYVGPYGYMKLANVQSKTRFGGMENASAIFYSENSVTGKRQIEGLLAHEIAHQWFGNMASEKNFSHVWLSEGFATYFTNLYMENKYGKERLKEMLRSQRDEVVNYSKQTKKAVLDTASNYMQLLNPNSYEKGGWILHMLRVEVGDENFQKIIRNYYSKYAGKNADSDDFRLEAEAVSGKDLALFFKQWLTVPGQPDLDIRWQYDPKKQEVSVKVIQKQASVFSFHLQLKFETTGAPVMKEIKIEKKEQTFSFPFNQKPAKLIADPDVHLLAVLNVIEK